MRPILSAMDSPSYNLAKELSQILTPLTGHMQYTVKNSAVFAERIRGIQITPEDRLVSFDGTSLFTQVPIDKALRVVDKQLTKDQTLGERTTIHVPHQGF